VRCPLCSGPVHNEDGEFVCEVGHRVTDDDMAKTTEIQVSEALWMAINALENEAGLLRSLPDGKGMHFADIAETQARQLREFAQGHAITVNDVMSGQDPDGDMSP
jgi:hypothetical protein